jgi:AICAR transformylase/IMP cyclohydrolase PurH
MKLFSKQVSQMVRYYGENPHQKDSSLVILTPCLINYTEKNSYNNLLDVDAVNLIAEFKTDDPLLPY